MLGGTGAAVVEQLLCSWAACVLKEDRGDEDRGDEVLERL
jgi:hypothetical protein